MRYEDASGAFQASGPIANDDSDTLSAGQRGPATGNLITGEGTQYGSAGADSAAGGHITSIAGKGGEDSSFAGGKLSVTGEHGQLSVDAQGNYSYLANAGAPENVRDRFTYTLADNQGNTDTASLIVEIGKTPVVIKADAQQIVPGPDGVVTLPPGVELSDIMVVGRNLVINMPDGTQLVIVDGAVFVPQLVLDGVEVPASNVAALLIGQEPQPAAGETPPSSGGNFALPPPPLDPGIPLGDLIPPTEYNYIPPEPQEVFDELDSEPTITIQPDGQPAAVNAVDSVDEAGLPERDGDLLDEPEGSGEEAAAGDNGDPSEGTSGVIHIDSPDGPSVVTINGVAVTSVGQVFQGAYGTLTITSISDTEIGYSYLLSDNIDHSDGAPDQDDFSVTVTDVDGDQATATLTIDIINDVPIARDDTDAVIKGDTSTDGNVMSGVGTTSAPGGVDTVGADDAEVTGVHAGTSGSFVAVPDGGVTVVGQFGDLTIFPDGSYTYTLHAEVGDGGNDVFTYQLTDGDGDTDPATLTITVPPDLKPTLDAPNVGEAGTLVDEAGLPPRGETPGTGEVADGDPNNESDDSEITTGTINFTPGDTPAAITIDGAPVTGVIGQTFPGDYGTLTITGFNPNGSITYTYTLTDNVDHDSDLTPYEEFDIVITDVDGDQASDTLRIDIINDAPIARDDTDSVIEGDSTDGNVLTGADTTSGAAGADTPGADGYAPNTVVGVVAGDTNTNVTDGTGVGVNVGGTWGTLVLGADGSYTYQANADSDPPPGSQDVFTYTIIDNDGNATNATLTIDVIDDLTPTANTPAEVWLDDDTEAGGNPGGSGDRNPDTQNDTGFLTGSGGDGDLDFYLSASQTLPSGFTYAFDGAAPAGEQWLIISQGGTPVIRVELVNETGAYEVTQLAAIDHAADGNTEGEILLGNLIDEINVSFYAQDADGDQSPTANLTITVDDDTPTASAAQLTGTVDEDGVLEGAADNGPGDGIAGGDGDVAGQVVSAVGNVSALFNSGADQPLTYSLLDNFAGLTAQNLKSGGTALSYSVGFDGTTYTLTATAGPGGYTVFTFTLNATTGAYNFTLVDQLDHLTLDGLGGDNTENDLTVNLSSIIQATDADGDSVTAGASGLIITVDDDTPIATNVQLTGTVDEDGVIENAAPGIQKGDGIAGGDGDVAGEVVVANGNVSTLFQSGADEPLSYSLSNSFAALTSQGLTSGGTALSYSVGFDGTTYTLTATAGPGGDPVFTFTLNASTGAYTFTLIDQLDHLTLNELPGDNTENDLTINLSSIIQATDFDGDTVSAGANGLIITVDDDSPKINAVDATLQVDNVGPTPSATGTFDFDIGADENADNDDISVSNFAVSVNGVPLDPSDFSLTPVSENATTATYSFSFDYDTGIGGPATATGTLVFDKIAGTYTVTLTSGVLEGTSILQTASGTLFQGYEFGTSNLDGSQPEISVTQIRGDPLDPQSTDLFVQFTSVSEPSSGTGDDALEVTSWVPGVDNPPPVDGGGDTSWSAGQVFNQDDGWVSTSNDANGVDGDTIQGGEVLDFTLVQGANPTGILADPSTYGQASSMFLKFDGIGAQEDMIVILKLYDPVADIYTTKAVMITNSDIFKGPADNDPNTAAPSLPEPYQDIVLDNNDGFVVIESNDYNFGSENWVIVGAQIAGSDEDVTGTAINLNSAVGDAGSSDLDDDGVLDVAETQSFQTDVNDGPFKISSIGFLTESTTEQTAELSFDVTIEDYDGDSLTQHIDVTIGETDSPMPVPLLAETEQSSDTSSFSLLASDSQEQQLQKTAANSNTTLLAAAAAAAGMAESIAAARGDNGRHRGQDDDHVTGRASKNVDHHSVSDDGGDAAVSMLVADSAPADSGPADSSSSSSSAPAESSQSVDDGSASAAPESSGSDAGEAPAEAANDASPVAPAVAMVSAEALQAAAADHGNGKGGSVHEIVADALGHGDAPTVDAILAGLPGEVGDLAAISHMASPDGAAVSGWDMAGHGALASAHDMMLSMHAANMHHDAVQPAVNG